MTRLGQDIMPRDASGPTALRQSGVAFSSLRAQEELQRPDHLIALAAYAFHQTDVVNQAKVNHHAGRSASFVGPLHRG